MAKLANFSCPQCTVEFTISTLDVEDTQTLTCPACGEEVEEPDDDEDDED